MARAKSWYTLTVPSGDHGDAAFLADATIASGLVDPTVLRTRAFVGVTHASNDQPPFTHVNAQDPLALRVLITDAATPPDLGWEGQASGFEDVIFHPVVWETGLYVPGAAEFGRPEFVYSNGYLAGGVADSHGQRHLPGDSVDVGLSYYLGPVLAFTTGADPEFAAQLWFRCLIEATI